MATVLLIAIPELCKLRRNILGGMKVLGFPDNGLLCDLDSLRYLVEHNTGSVVILVALLGFLFWRVQKFVADLLIFIYRKAPLGKATKAALEKCLRKPISEERDSCVQGVVVGRLEKGRERLSWIFELFLNTVALILIAVGVIVCYLIVSPPVACSVPGDYGITIPSVFKKVQNKGGELLYVDETNRSYVRIWPGAKHEYQDNGPSFDDLVDRYREKKREATKQKAANVVFDEDVAPLPGSRYFALRWRDRDNFEVYFVARLVPRKKGKMYIDSFEISSPTHGNGLVRDDYNILFCSFVRPSASDLPENCPRP